MKAILTITTVALGLTGAAQAGSYTPPVIEAPVLVNSGAFAGPSWTGFYAGAQMSYGDFSVNRDGVGDASGGIYGIHAGYNHQSPNGMVVGGEFTFDHSAAENDVWKVERLISLRGKVGMTHGNWLFYGLAGYAHVRTEGRADGAHGKSGGVVVGIGADRAINDKWALGGTWESYKFSNFKNDTSDAEVDGGTIKFRASYRF
ncbi:outer membrane protein [Paracoccus denitrificans]|uniref:outer membrane protein n=1 Tax=Paracoccus denitrificans TaxID=266 RepID=UPI000CEC7CE9|nr:porin family protein [Paracoccus denitrificans]UFS67175.1 porin family protein [Paracoccus denitrificans]